MNKCYCRNKQYESDSRSVTGTHLHHIVTETQFRRPVSLVFFLTVEEDEGRKDPSGSWSEKEFGPVWIEALLMLGI